MDSTRNCAITSLLRAPVASRMPISRAVRQEEITTELLDVIIGFEAMKSREKRQRELAAETDKATQDAIDHSASGQH